jgi:serine/threonine protein kinase
VDNPVWLAPEVMKAEDYNEKADVYSFAVIMYELLAKTPFMGHVSFLSDIESMVIAGTRPDIPDTPECHLVPEWVQIMRDCWEGDAEKRPTLSDVYARLVDIRNQLFPEVTLPPAPASMSTSSHFISIYLSLY